MEDKKGMLESGAEASIKGFVTAIHPSGEQETIEAQVTSLVDKINEQKEELNFHQELAKLSAKMAAYYSYLNTDAHTLYDGNKPFLTVLEERIASSNKQVAEMDGDKFAKFPQLLISNTKVAKGIKSSLDKLKKIAEYLERDLEQDDMQLNEIIRSVDELEKDLDDSEKFKIEKKLKALKLSGAIKEFELYRVLEKLPIDYNDKIAPHLSELKSIFAELSGMIKPLQQDLQKNTDDLKASDAEIQAKSNALANAVFMIESVKEALVPLTVFKSVQIHEKPSMNGTMDESEAPQDQIQVHIVNLTKEIESAKEKIEMVDGFLRKLNAASVLKETGNQPITAFEERKEATERKVNNLALKINALGAELSKIKRAKDLSSIVSDLKSFIDYLPTLDRKAEEVEALNAVLGNVKFNSDIKEYLLKIGAEFQALPGLTNQLVSDALSIIETQNYIRQWADNLYQKFSLKKEWEKSSYDFSHSISKDLGSILDKGKRSDSDVLKDSVRRKMSTWRNDHESGVKETESEQQKEMA